MQDNAGQSATRTLSRSGPSGATLAPHEFGRRIVRDAYTGEIISIERPRRYERRQQRRHQARPPERVGLQPLRGPQRQRQRRGHGDQREAERVERAGQAAGWMKTLRGEESSEADEYGITSFVYRARKPFHPQRFHRLVTQGLGNVIWIVDLNRQSLDRVVLALTERFSNLFAAVGVHPDTQDGAEPDADVIVRGEARSGVEWAAVTDDAGSRTDDASSPV